MIAEIITIGDEILIGQITDTNSKWIAERLNEIGISVYQITSIQDDREHIIKTLREAERNVDIIMITGGLGPTKDDITKNTLAEYFDDELTYRPEVAEHIKQLFSKISIRVTHLDDHQAMLPSKSLVLKNRYGTASGMWFNENGKIVVSLPGVPFEMKGLMSESVIPKLQTSLRLPFIIHKTMQTYGLGESRVAERLEAWESLLPKHIKMAYLPSFGKLRLRLSGKGFDQLELKASIDEQMKKLEVLLEDIFVGYEEAENIEQVIHKICKTNKITVSSAESCTGGKIAQMITAIPGASNFYKGSVIAYSKEIKQQVLGVAKELIEKHSVVSAEVAEEMALRCREIFQTDYAISTTGNAGPGIDETDQSVGTVFIAIASKNGVLVEEYNFGRPREKVINKAANKALEMLKNEIKKNY
ncbi:MAG: competence/damage-inducible protein A [Lutimonas sp.]